MSAEAAICLAVVMRSIPNAPSGKKKGPRPRALQTTALQTGRLHQSVPSKASPARLKLRLDVQGEHRVLRHLQVRR